jgi:hypothetical protein
MKIAIVLALVLAAVAFVHVLRGRRASRTAAEAAAVRARNAARKPRVPDVSNNLKGITASQTIEPYRPAKPESRDGDRAA